MKFWKITNCKNIAGFTHKDHLQKHECNIKKYKTNFERKTLWWHHILFYLPCIPNKPHQMFNVPVHCYRVHSGGSKICQRQSTNPWGGRKLITWWNFHENLPFLWGWGGHIPCPPNTLLAGKSRPIVLNELINKFLFWDNGTINNCEQ